MYDYDKFYKKFPVNQHDMMELHSNRFASIAELCKGQVLDVACGTGSLADYYFGSYTGYDISQVAIDEAREIRRKDADFFVRDCVYPEFVGERKWDTIVVAEFFEHIENDDVLLANIKKWLKPDGRLIISCPNGPRIPDPTHVRELTIPKLRKKLSPFGKVKFYNWSGAAGQILCTVDFGQKNDDLVSLVMCVKDEEKGLEKAILSCIEFVDNIVISVDSKSTDGTGKIAELYADELRTHVFDDDFSKMRNEAHQGIKTKWILFLDGHEYVDKCENLEKYLQMDVGGLLVTIQMENEFIFHNPRFYKNGIQFKDKVHEQQQCETTYFNPEFIIKHDRLSTQSEDAQSFRAKQRDDMIPRIMGAQVKKDKKNIRALFHLAVFWQGRAQWKKALGLYKNYLKYSKNTQERWFVLFNCVMCRQIVGHKFRAYLTANRAEKEMPGRWEMQKLKGMMFHENKEWERALVWFNSSFHDNKMPTLYRPMQRDDSNTWNLIGECFFNLYNFDKAGIAFDRASELAKVDEQKIYFKQRADLMREMLKSQFAK
jgi:SAM-dependent methyltransferase